MSLADGIPLPTFPTISTGTLKPSPTASPTTYLPSISTVTFPAYFNRGYYESWNVTVQHEFSPTLTGQVAYVGTHGVHVDMNVNINGSAPNTGNAGRQLYPYVTTDLNMVEPFGDMTYNGLQATLKKRIGSSMIGASYAFSRSIDNINGDNDDGTFVARVPGVFRAGQATVRHQPRSRHSTFTGYTTCPSAKGTPCSTADRQRGLSAVGRFPAFSAGSAACRSRVGTSSSINAGGQGTSATQINPVVKILGGH